MTDTTLMSCFESEKKIINVTSLDRIETNSSSKGNQIKWYKDNQFIKFNTWQWYEAVSEVMVSQLLKHTNIAEYVSYYPCTIIEDGQLLGDGCYSNNFLKNGEQDITFARILKNSGISLMDASFDVVRDTIFDVTGLDVKEYIGNCLCLDAITYNEDRHLNNFSLIRTTTGYRTAPIFDNGLACLSDIFTYPFSADLDENLSKVKAKPFSTNFITQIKDNMITPIYLDIESFLNNIKATSKEEQRALEVIKKGLKHREGIAWERY